MILLANVVHTVIIERFRAISVEIESIAICFTLKLNFSLFSGNLGSAFFSKGSYKEALTSHRYQLVLAMKFKDSEAAASALTSLGEYNLSNQRIYYFMKTKNEIQSIYN